MVTVGFLPETEPRRSARRRAALWLAGYGVVYGTLLALLHAREHFPVGEPLFVLLVIGMVFPALAWLLLRRAEPLPLPVRRPAAEVATLGACLLFLVWFLTYGLSALQAIPGRTAYQAALAAAKLVVFVAGPALLFRRGWGYRFEELFPLRTARARDLGATLWLALAGIVLQAVFGRGLRDLAAAHFPPLLIVLGGPLVFAWLALEAGLVEEFFFRALLQTRLAALLRSETAAIVVASLLFGLAHVPGYYFRTSLTLEALGPHPSVLRAIGYGVVVTSVTGLFFGILWARTRNPWLVVIVHAAMDWLPNLKPLLEAWLATLGRA